MPATDEGSRDSARVAKLLVVAALVACTVRPLHSQALRADLTVTNRYLWRGISRTSGSVGQLQLAAMARLVGGALAAGVFESREAGDAEPGELTGVGEGRQGLSERNWWLEYRRPLGNVALSAGITRFTFHGNRLLGARSSADNTTEVSVGIQSRLTYLSPSLFAHVDVDRVRGLYLEGSGALPLLGWPYPPQWNVYLDGVVGLNLGQGPNPSRPGQLAYYARNGFTHVAGGISADIKSWEHVTAGGGFRLQAGIDDRARMGENGRDRDLFFSIWLGTTLRLGRLTS